VVILKLTPLASSHVKGIYTADGFKGRLPARMRFLHPAVALMFSKIAAWAVVSDMFRSPESSLQAVREGRGAQSPGYSGHNYGLSIDLDIGASMENLAATRGVGSHRVSKETLDGAMAAAGFYCHRLDHKMEHEAWHYNGLGNPNDNFPGRLLADWPVIPPQGTRTHDELEKLIVRLYGADLRPNPTECQHMLKKLRLYHGEVDGIIGRLSREAVRAFQRTWGLAESGILEERTRRTLAYVTAEREMVLELPT
jgi:peptidoglycan hydrolase-like protein with peptidoglycan-binding domain